MAGEDDVTPVIWLYLLVLIPYGLFVLLYAFRSPWYRSWLGRSLLLSKLVIALLALNAVLVLAFEDYPGRDFVRAFVVGGAIVAGWSQLFLLIREQRAARRCNQGDFQER
jgi:hypothetical protein